MRFYSRLLFLFQLTFLLCTYAPWSFLSFSLSSTKFGCYSWYLKGLCGSIAYVWYCGCEIMVSLHKNFVHIQVLLWWMEESNVLVILGNTMALGLIHIEVLMKYGWANEHWWTSIKLWIYKQTYLFIAARYQKITVIVIVALSFHHQLNLSTWTIDKRIMHKHTVKGHM